jgi:multiple sugar transport system ATP-binding protein
VFSFELTGDATQVTLREGGQLITARAGKQYRTTIGARVGLAADPAHCYLFDGKTQLRLKPTEPPKEPPP